VLPPPTPPVRLYCFPYAGSTSAVYRSWVSAAASRFDIRAVDPPGRGLRARESPAVDYAALIEDLSDRLTAELRADAGDDGSPPYVTFGHSFGALISLAVVAEVVDRTGHPPLRAVLSAGLPPARHVPVNEAAALDDEALRAHIAGLGGTPPELLAGGPLTRHLLRMFRQDHATRSEFHGQTRLRVDVPLTLIAAEEDPDVPPEEMWRWSAHTSGPCRRVIVPGGHFAAVREPARTLAVIAEDLLVSAQTGDVHAQ
jgi:surfactin synthase thioesterase subunit